MSRAGRQRAFPPVLWLALTLACRWPRRRRTAAAQMPDLRTMSRQPLPVARSAHRHGDRAGGPPDARPTRWRASRSPPSPRGANGDARQARPRPAPTAGHLRGTCPPAPTSRPPSRVDGERLDDQSVPPARPRRRPHHAHRGPGPGAAASPAGGLAAAGAAAAAGRRPGQRLSHGRPHRHRRARARSAHGTLEIDLRDAGGHPWSAQGAARARCA